MRTWLYTPANNPSRMVNAPLYGSDGVVFDLEDSIAHSEKDEARFLLEEAVGPILQDIRLQQRPCQLAVRINGLDTPWWKKDLLAALKAGITLVRVPKVESVEELRSLEHQIEAAERSLGLSAGSTTLQLILETPVGIEQAFVLGGYSQRITSLSFGAEDYCAYLGIKRKHAGYALDYPRSRLASAAAAFGIEAYDSVWGFLDDAAGLIEDAQRAKQLGFTGKSVIHPNQIEAVNDIFTPGQEDVEAATKILEAVKSQRDGVLAVDGRMVDTPVLLWAQRVLKNR